MFSTIYEILLKNYGRQGWWPVTAAGKLAPEYSGGPRTTRQCLEVMYGAILTQNTSWQNVTKAIKELNQQQLISIKGIERIPPEKLAKLIRSSGYFNQKAIKLKALAAFLNKHSLKKLRGQKIPELRKILLDVKGIGPETADSIILYALKKPIFVVDAYTRRIFSRAGLIEEDAQYDEIQSVFQQDLPQNAPLFNEYHALIVEHAKSFCRKKPLCTDCPLNKLCRKLIYTPRK